MPTVRITQEIADEMIEEKVEAMLSSYNYKSHTLTEMADAIVDGKELWLLDSPTSGDDDDVLIVEKGEMDEIIMNIEVWYDGYGVPRDTRLERIYPLAEQGYRQPEISPWEYS